MKLGKDLRIGYVDDQGRFKQFAWAQSCSYDKTTTFVKVSSPNIGGWEHVRPKTKGWVMQHEGLLGNPDLVYEYDGQQYNFLDLISHFQDNNISFEVRWLDVSTDGTVGELKRGTAYIKSHKEVASEKALAKVSVALQGTGPLEDLRANNLKGSFAYSISGTTLSLYALQRPVAGFNITVKNGDVISDTGQTWDPTGDTLQTFTINALQPTSVIGGVKGTAVQHNLTFTDSTTLHVVLVQTTTQDEQQQPVRTVQALWWGGYAMGNMTVRKTRQTGVTLTTAGREKSSDAVTPFPFDILTGDTTITLTGTGQTIHCIDRTSSTQRTIGATQTTRNADGGNPYTGAAFVGPAPFGCDVTIWANDADGNEVMRVTVPHGASYTDTTYTALIPDAQHIHFQLEGLGTDDGGPYKINRSIVYDLEDHDVYYAYDATTQTMRIYAPDQIYATVLMLDGTPAYTGLFYTTDAQGNRQPITLTGIASFSTISTSRGTYTFHDVSALTVFNLSNTLVISALPLDDIVLTGQGGTEVGRITALSDPALTYPTWAVVTTPGTLVTGAQMPAGAAQSLTYQTYSQSVRVRATATQTGEDAWTISVSLRNSDGSVATLPGDLLLRWSNNSAITIAAGKGGTSASVNNNPSWIIPTATLNHPQAADFNIYTAPTPDITEDHWVAYKLGLVNGSYYYDIAYTGGSHQGIRLTGSFMETAAPIRIAEGQEVADRLYVTTGSVSIAARAADAPEWSAATIDHINVNTTDNLVLSYRIGEVGGMPVTNLTNIKDYNGGVPVYSRHSCISDILPFVGVAESYVTIYNRVGLEGLKPGNTEAFEAQALYGIYSGDDSGVNVRAHFMDNNGNTISVGSGLTGVNVLAVNHSAELPFA